MTCIWLNLLTEEKLIHINDAVNKLQVRLLKTTILPQKCAAQTISKENNLRDIFVSYRKPHFLSPKIFFGGIQHMLFCIDPKYWFECTLGPLVLPFSAENMDMILLRGLSLFSSGTEGRGLELGFVDILSLMPKLLLILTGGAGGLSSSSPFSDMTGKHTQKGNRVSEINLQMGGRETNKQLKWIAALKTIKIQQMKRMTKNRPFWQETL